MDEPEPLTPLQKRYLERNPKAKLVTDNDPKPTSENLVGIGGWLALLTIGLLVLGPLANVVMTQSEFDLAESGNVALASSSDWQSLKFLIWCLVGLQVLLSVFAGYMLAARKRPSTIPIVIACLWICGPVISIVARWVIGAGADYGPELARPVIVTALWTAYLLRSRRVKNTYSLAARA